MAKHTEQTRTGSGANLTSSWYDPGTAPWETNPDQYDVSDVEGRGQQVAKKGNWLDRNMWWIAPAGIAAGGSIGAGGGGAAAGGGGAAPTLTTQGMYDAGMFAGPAGVPGTVAGATTGAGLGTYAATGAAGAAGAAGRALNNSASGGGSIMDFFNDPKNYAGLAGLIASLAAKPGGGSGGGDLLSQNPQLQEMLTMSADRAKRTDPLHQAVTQLAMQRLPTNVQR